MKKKEKRKEIKLQELLEKFETPRIFALIESEMISNIVTSSVGEEIICKLKEMGFSNSEIKNWIIHIIGHLINTYKRYEFKYLHLKPDMSEAELFEYNSGTTIQTLIHDVLYEEKAFDQSLERTYGS